MKLFIAIGFAELLLSTAAKLALAGDQRSRVRSRHAMSDPRKLFQISKIASLNRPDK